MNTTALDLLKKRLEKVNMQLQNTLLDISGYEKTITCYRRDIVNMEREISDLLDAIRVIEAAYASYV